MKSLSLSWSEMTYHICTSSSRSLFIVCAFLMRRAFCFCWLSYVSHMSISTTNVDEIDARSDVSPEKRGFGKKRS